MNEQSPIRLVLVDDHAAIRESLAALLNRQPDMTVVGEAGTLAEMRCLLESGLDVDVALIDLDLPDGDGVELIRDVRRRNPNAVALVLTASRDQREYARAVAAGAAGVLHKSMALQPLFDVIRRAHAGEALISRGDALALMKDAAQAAEEERQVRAALQSLTHREREILQSLAEGLNNEAIAERLGISERTVRNHVVTLLDKLGVESRLQAVVLAARHGAVRFR